MARIKQLWSFIPLPAHLKLMWTRLTASRLGIFYLIMTIAHALIQVTLQITALTVNGNALTLLSDIVTTGGMQSRNFTLYDMKSRSLRSCWGVPGEGSGQKCITIWMANATVEAAVPLDAYGYFASVEPTPSGSFNATDGTSVVTEITLDVVKDVPESSIPTSANAMVGQAFQRRTRATIAPLPSGAGAVRISGDQNNKDLDLPAQCVSVLRWPLQKLQDTQREDIVFIGFQVWVLGMSIVALLNESIPHIIAALLTHFLATMWSGYQLANTQDFRRDFIALTAAGACNGVNLLPHYWKERGAAEISLLVLNCVGLVASALLSWKLIKMFGWATFRRIGADRKINKIYTVVLLMSIFLQLSLFFIVTSMALWIDQLCFGPIGKFSEHMMIYQAIDICIFFLLVPWLALGWFGVRKENRKMMYAFTGISVFLVGQWASEFLSDTWRLTFMTWDFFALMSIVAAVLTVGVTVLGVVCFRQFGQGLTNHLKPEEVLDGEDFQRVTPPAAADVETGSRMSSASSFEEKVAFPDASNIPTYGLPFTPSPRRHANSISSIGTQSTNKSVSSGGRSLAQPPRAQLPRESVQSTFSAESDANPFHLAEKLSTPQNKIETSRWSKDSSVALSGRKPTVLVKRWIIE